MKTSLLRFPLSLLALLAATGMAWATPPAAPAAKSGHTTSSTSVVFVAARPAVAKPAAAVAAPRAPVGEAVSADGDRFRYDSCGCLGG